MAKKTTTTDKVKAPKKKGLKKNLRVKAASLSDFEPPAVEDIEESIDTGDDAPITDKTLKSGRAARKATSESVEVAKKKALAKLGLKEEPIKLEGLALTSSLLKDLVSSFYQIQKLRIQMGNKLVAHFYRKMGLDAAKKMVEQETGDRKSKITLLNVLAKDYQRIADFFSNDGIAGEKDFVELTKDGRGVFSEWLEFSWMTEYRKILSTEKQILSDVDSILVRFQIWNEWLSKIKGVGPTIGAVILSTVDPRKSETPAALWSLAGLDVVPINNEGVIDGRGRGRYREHLVEVEYIDRDGNENTRMSITFNPFLKTKLVGVLASIMIKHSTPIYRQNYDDYKLRIQARQKLHDEFYSSYGEKAFVTKYETTYVKRTPAHINRMALRYMIKRFLVDLYVQWRTIEGLEVVPEWSEAKLGLKHHQGKGRWGAYLQKIHAAKSFSPEDHPEHTPDL